MRLKHIICCVLKSKFEFDYCAYWLILPSIFSPILGGVGLLWFLVWLGRVTLLGHKMGYRSYWSLVVVLRILLSNVEYNCKPQSTETTTFIQHYFILP